MLTDSNNTTTITKEQQIVEQLQKDGWSLFSTIIDAGGYNKDSCFGILLNYKGKHEFTTKYHKGWGHRQWIHSHILYGFDYHRYWDKYYRRGKIVNNIPANLKDPSTMGHHERKDEQQKIFDDFSKLTKPIPPTLDEVVWSLYVDSTCVSNGQTFEEWCEDFEYSTDSINANKIYNICRDAYFFFVKCGISFGYLNELFRDY